MLKSLAFIAATVASAEKDPNWKKFVEFKMKFDLEFENQEEDTLRYDVFKKNMQKAEELNMKSGGKARFGPTKFSHLSPEEFKKTHLGSDPNHPNAAELLAKAKKKTHFSAKLTQLKGKSVDWRTTGAVSPVKDQGQCGSCWAFSATEAVETGYFFNTGNQVVLSPQQTVSCSTSDYGCQGGWTLEAYKYMEAAGGLEPESDYPYVSGGTGRGGTCKADKSEFTVKVLDPTVISQDASTEDAMLKEIHGSPMSICVDASSWQWYTGGVVDSSTCGTNVDHCVQVVGYESGHNAWIVRNSWNTNWGEEGYIRVKAGENACAVASMATVVDAEPESASKIDI